MLAAGGFDPARDIEAITDNRWPHGYAYGYDPFVVRFADSGRGMTQGKVRSLFDVGFSTNGTRVGVGMGCL